MTRPCFLVLDREHSGTISTRKLVIESAKFNVITAYSGSEALDTLERFPAVDAVLLNASIPDMPCEQIMSSIRARSPKLPIIVVDGPGAPACPGADYNIASFDPIGVLELLRRLFPGALQAIKRKDDALKVEEDVAPREANRGPAE